MLAVRLATVIGVLCSCLDAGSADAAPPNAAPTGRFVRPPKRRLVTSLPLTSAVHGIEGKMQLFLDERVAALDPEEATSILLGVGRRGDENVGEVETRTASFERVAPLNAQLWIVDGEGKVVASETFERAVAKLKRAPCVLPSPLYEIMVDFTFGMGSFNGPISSFLQIVAGKPQWLIDSTRGKRLAVMKSLKTTWRIEHDRAGKCDILQAASRPAEWSGGQEGEYRILYWRTSLEAGAWKTYRRWESGFEEYEVDDPRYPPRAKFP